MKTKYTVSIPISGYYTVDVEASNKEEAIELVIYDSTHDKNLYDMYKNFSVTDLSLDDCKSDDVICEQL